MSSTATLKGGDPRRAVEKPESPYPGLRAFQLGEWSVFFGRERMVDDVIERIGESHLVLVHGSSGNGKSSLVRAGVIAQLAREHRSRGLDWRPATMMPGSSPMWHFAAALDAALRGTESPDHDQISRIRLRLNRRANGVEEVLQSANFHDRQRLFVLVDQFEEIFRFADESPDNLREANQFVRLLVDLHERRIDNLYLVITMRSDHLGDCSRFPGLAEMVNASQYLVPPMDEVELKDAIQRPAALYNGLVEDELALQLIRDTRDIPDQLPLIQHVLAYMWRLQGTPDAGQPRRLGLACYRDKDVESAARALSHHADSVLEAIETEHADATRAAEGIFRALTKFDYAGRAIRRRLDREELLAEVHCPAELLDAVIAAFAASEQSFLVVEDADPERDPKIDIGHEALIRHWLKLSDESLDSQGNPKGWVAREAADGRIWQSLVATVETAEDRSAIVLSKAVYETRWAWWQSRVPTPAWASKHGNQFEAVKELFERSLGQVHKEEKREIERKQVLERVRQLTVWTAVISLAAAVGLGGFAYHTYRQGERIQSASDEIRMANEKIKTANEELKNAWETVKKEKNSAVMARNVAVGTLKTLWANTVKELQNQPDIQDSVPMPGILVSLEFLPDTKSSIETRRSWPKIDEVEAEFRQEFEQFRHIDGVLGGHTDAVNGVAFSRDGPRIATSSVDGTVRVWDVDTLELLARLSHPAPANGHKSTTASADEQTAVATAEPVSVNRVAFSPDGRRLVSGSSSEHALVWDIDERKVIHQLSGSGDNTWGVAWSNDGALIATGSNDGVLRLWNAETGELANELGGGTDEADVSPLQDVAFSHQGVFVASGTDDGRARIWDVATGTEIKVLEGHQDSVYGIAWSPDDTLLATGGADASIRLWDTGSWSEKRRFTHTAGDTNEEVVVFGVEFSPDGRRLAAGSAEGGVVKVWDIETGDFQTFGDHKSTVDGVTWSPDGSLLLVGASDWRTWLFRVGGADGPSGLAERPLQELVERSKRMVPRCFTEQQRGLLSLGGLIPEWCTVPTRKPPFDAPGRVERAAELLMLDPPLVDEALKTFNLAVSLDPSNTASVRKTEAEAMIENAVRYLGDGADSLDRMKKRRALAERLGDRAIALDRKLKPRYDDAVLAFLIESGRTMLRSNASKEATKEATKAATKEEAPATQAFAAALKFAEALNKGRNTRQQVITARLEAAEDAGEPKRALQLALELELEPDAGLLARVLGLDQPTATLEVPSLISDGLEVDGLAYSPDGRFIATGADDAIVRLWDANSRQLISELLGHDAYLVQVAFSPDSRRLVSTADDYTAIVWDVESGALLHKLLGHEGTVRGVAWSPDGARIVTGSSDNDVRVWDAETGAPLGQRFGHTAAVNDVAFDPAGSRFVSVSDDGTARIWRLESNQQVARLDLEEWYEGAVRAVDWSPDGQLVATGGDDTFLRLWDSAKFAELASLEHPGPVTAVAFNPDGTLLASASGNQEHVQEHVQEYVWRVDSKELVRVLGGADAGIDAIAWSPDGAELASASNDAIVRIYQTPTEASIGSLLERARERARPCLTPEQRESLNLDKAVPGWCEQVAEQQQ